MPRLLVLTVKEPDRILNAGAYGAGAIIRLQTATTAAGVYADVTGTGSTPTTGIGIGSNKYDAYDPNGVASSWYRTRIENVGATRVDDWSTPFQVGPEEGADLCSLYDVRQRLGITASSDTSDDEELTEFIREVTADIISYTGRRFVRTPLSGTATFLFDVEQATRTLWVPQGIASLTTLEIATTSQPESGGTYLTASAGDWMLRPVAHERTHPGGPATSIVIRTGATGNVTAFYSGQNTVRITGMLGWASVPADIAGIAQRAVVRRFKNRGAATVNRGGDPTDVSVRWTFSLEEQRKLDWYRRLVVA